MKNFFIFCKQMFAFFRNMCYYRKKEVKICSEGDFFGTYQRNSKKDI